MSCEFTIVRLKKNSEHTLSFPADLVALPTNPIAGPFSEATCARLVGAIGLFPNAQRIAGTEGCFLIQTPEGGRLEAWMTSDGHLFLDSEASDALVLELFNHLRLACDDLAIEDVQHGLLHTRLSFSQWLSAANQRAAA